MLNHKFGIEIEFTGITRNKAAKIAAKFLEGTISVCRDYYNTYSVTARDGRVWKFMSDGSILCQKKQDGQAVAANKVYSVELVSPILLYRQDIETLQGLVRALRKAGGFANSTCGIHIHLDGAEHTPRSIRNFVNIIASHNDLLYRSLRVESSRMHYCKKLDAYLVEQINRQKPVTFSQLEEIWYKEYSCSPNQHYHQSRYYFLNLHSFFHGNHTVELRGFNGTLHAGKVRAYIALSLALNHQALTLTNARYKQVQDENLKFAMRTFLCRLGLKGKEYKACREHLCRHLPGNSAWRYGTDRHVITNGGNHYA